MMHSPEYARAWMAPHNQPTLARVVPAIGVSAPATAQRLSNLEKSVLQHREVSIAVVCRDDHLAIDDLATRDIHSPTASSRKPWLSTTLPFCVIGT